MKSYDVVTFGETMIRLSPPSNERLEQATQMEVHVGGSESNTAVGLSRLGIKVAWVSRLTDNALGRMIAGTLKRYDVDTSHVVWTPEDRVGTYYFEAAPPPRGSRVIYDRRGSAMANIKPADFDQRIFETQAQGIFHTTGITLGISQSSAQTALHAARLAKQAAWKVSFDVNYRSGLWNAKEAIDVCDPLMQLADIIFLPIRDARLLFDLDDSKDAEACARTVQSRYPHAVVVITLGKDGAIAVSDEHICHQSAFETQPVERLGGGDAFSAGFLARYVRDGSIEECLRYGCAVAALKYTIRGDWPLIEIAEVERLLSSNCSSLRR
jgi:2-dehydro-3-deoxygluconokinase